MSSAGIQTAHVVRIWRSVPLKWIQFRDFAILISRRNAIRPQHWRMFFVEPWSVSWLTAKIALHGDWWCFINYSRLQLHRCKHHSRRRIPHTNQEKGQKEGRCGWTKRNPSTAQHLNQWSRPLIHQSELFCSVKSCYLTFIIEFLYSHMVKVSRSCKGLQLNLVTLRIHKNW